VHGSTSSQGAARLDEHVSVVLVVEIGTVVEVVVVEPDIVVELVVVLSGSVEVLVDVVVGRHSSVTV
jgi:hypothetical protein